MRAAIGEHDAISVNTVVSNAGCRDGQNQALDRNACADRRSGRATTRREHRGDGPRDGEFWLAAFAIGETATRVAERKGARDGGRRHQILDGAALYESLNDAIGDCSFVLATTARNHDQAKPVISADAAAAEMAQRVFQGENVAIIFGRERIGLENHEVALADR